MDKNMKIHLIWIMVAYFFEIFIYPDAKFCVTQYIIYCQIYHSICNLIILKKKTEAEENSIIKQERSS